jgi:hypothetical protein
MNYIYIISELKSEIAAFKRSDFLHLYISNINIDSA